jgi:hypothetical protein
MFIDYQFTDAKVEPGKTYFYYLQDIDIAGEKSNSEIIRVVVPPVKHKPKAFQLLQNYPNPFNPETWLPYQLQGEADVTIFIYNIEGQLVHKLDLGHKSAGYYLSKSKAAYWNGRNSAGEPVTNGVYLYTLRAGDFQATRRMVIIK